MDRRCIGCPQEGHKTTLLDVATSDESCSALGSSPLSTSESESWSAARGPSNWRRAASCGWSDCSSGTKVAAYFGLRFTTEDVVEAHHWDGNRHNNRYANLVLLHGHCHDEIHGKRY